MPKQRTIKIPLLGGGVVGDEVAGVGERGALCVTDAVRAPILAHLSEPELNEFPE